VSTPLLDQPAQRIGYANLEHQQHDRARQEAEALFRPGPERVEHATPSSASTEEAPVRKPRILSAVPPAPNFGTAEIEARLKPPAAVLESARAARGHLSQARDAIVRQQQELRAKLETIETELRAIAAYEAERRSNGPTRPRVR